MRWRASAPPSCRWRPRAWSFRPMSTGGCARNSAARWCRPQAEGEHARRALCDAGRAASAIAVRRAGDRFRISPWSRKKVDAVYVTRFQKERWTDKDQPYPKIDAKFLKEPKYSDASVLHPLPRVGELDVSLRFRPPRRLFRAGSLWRAGAHGADLAAARPQRQIAAQASATVSKTANIRSTTSRSTVGMRCANANCIVHDPMEAQYVRNKFYVVKTGRRSRLHVALRLLRERQYAVRDRQQKTEMVHRRAGGAAARRPKP